MFDVVTTEDGSGIGFTDFGGLVAEGKDCEVRVDDIVILQCEGSKVEVVVKDIAEDSLRGEITSLPFGADLELELGDIVEFTLENIDTCKHP